MKKIIIIMLLYMLPLTGQADGRIQQVYTVAVNEYAVYAFRDVKLLNKISLSGSIGKYEPSNQTGWIVSYADAIAVALSILIIMALGLCLWVLFLRRTVHRHNNILALQFEMLRQSEKKHRGLLESMPGALLVIQDERIVYANSVALSLLGLDHQEAAGSRRFMDFVAGSCVDFVREKISHINIIDQKLQEVECKLLRQDGSEFDVAVFAAPSKHQGKPAIQIIFFDIGERKQAEEGLKEMQRQIEHTQRLESLGVLAGGIAHDFNNILTAIMGNAALAERKALADPAATKGYLTKVVQSSEKAALLCKQMLAYSGKGQFIVQPLDLSGMVKSITSLLEVSINPGVVLKYRLTESLALIEADESQVQQVIMNLVINASDAIGEQSGEIFLSTGLMQVGDACIAYTDGGAALLAEGDYVYMDVSDTGCGMSKETEEKIFDPFFTTKFTGRGLGMSAVLGIVRGHHGGIRVNSMLGRGTTFKLLFPVSDVTVSPNKEQLINEADWQASGTILIVDDEEMIRETAAAMLEDMGFETLTAINGLDGAAVYHQHQQKIVAVLLDMTMPKLDGKGCFRELCRINADVKVILSSGYNEAEATSRFSDARLAGFIQKPYLPEALNQVLRDVCLE